MYIANESSFFFLDSFSWSPHLFSSVGVTVEEVCPSHELVFLLWEMLFGRVRMTLERTHLYCMIPFPSLWLIVIALDAWPKLEPSDSSSSEFCTGFLEASSQLVNSIGCASRKLTGCGDHTLSHNTEPEWQVNGTDLQGKQEGGRMRVFESQRVPRFSASLSHETHPVPLLAAYVKVSIFT